MDFLERVANERPSIVERYRLNQSTAVFAGFGEPVKQTQPQPDKGAAESG
jgi:hypothetical protein